MLLVAALVFAAIVGGPAISLGQAPRLDSGTKVRITPIGFDSERVVGTFLSANKDSVRFVPNETRIPTSLATDHVRRIEIANGKHTHKLNGFLIGFVSAGVIGGALTAASWKDSGGEFDFGRWGDAAFVAVPSAVVGGLVGLAIGASGVESWKAVPLPDE